MHVKGIFVVCISVCRIMQEIQFRTTWSNRKCCTDEKHVFLNYFFLKLSEHFEPELFYIVDTFTSGLTVLDLILV